jgi:hypothetical protein
MNNSRNFHNSTERVIKKGSDGQAILEKDYLHLGLTLASIRCSSGIWPDEHRIEGGYIPDGPRVNTEADGHSAPKGSRLFCNRKPGRLILVNM